MKIPHKTYSPQTQNLAIIQKIILNKSCRKTRTRAQIVKIFKPVTLWFTIHKEISLALDFLQNRSKLYETFQNIVIGSNQNYIYKNFINFLNKYSINNSSSVLDYFSSNKTLEDLGKDFISFCFDKKISLSIDKTIQSFIEHNEISDAAIKRELKKISPKASINLLGFGLGDGSYEKNIATYLLQEKITKKVKIFGFDPYAKKESNIEYLTAQELLVGIKEKFDLVIARWVLHHVDLQHRWTHFIHCINQCNPHALVLIIEHGFLKKKVPEVAKKLYFLLNAFFDIIANIGIHPNWFTDTAPNIGANFFIHYLCKSDFTLIKNKSQATNQHIYSIGPNFPNQTICRMSI